MDSKELSSAVKTMTEEELDMFVIMEGLDVKLDRTLTIEVLRETVETAYLDKAEKIAAEEEAISAKSKPKKPVKGKKRFGLNEKTGLFFPWNSHVERHVINGTLVECNAKGKKL